MAHSSTHWPEGCAMPFGRHWLLIVTLLCGSVITCQAQVAAPAGPTAEQTEFFEKRVRPVLAERCYMCHGSRMQFGGVRLDSAGAIVRPSAKGRTPVVPGSPAQSA